MLRRKLPRNWVCDRAQTIEIRSAIEAVVTKSANDVAAAIAEEIGRDEKNFAEMMTRKAGKLRMSRTNSLTRLDCRINGKSPPPETWRFLERPSGSDSLAISTIFPRGRLLIRAIFSKPQPFAGQSQRNGWS
jgi:hypothetical protein